MGVRRTTGSFATCSEIHLATCSFSAFSRRQYSAEYSPDDDDEDEDVTEAAGVELRDVVVAVVVDSAVGFVVVVDDA